LNPFFDIVMNGLDGLVDGDHFWDAVADDAVFEFLYRFPGWPGKLESRHNYIKAMEGYGMRLQSADGLVVHRSQDQRTVISSMRCMACRLLRVKRMTTAFALLLSLRTARLFIGVTTWTLLRQCLHPRIHEQLKIHAYTDVA
jgi:hypothetical protein